MSDQIFLVAWDERGLETVVDLSELEQNIAWDILRTPDGISETLQNLIGRLAARFRSRQRDNPGQLYEVYILHVVEHVTQQQIWEMFAHDPQQFKRLAATDGVQVAKFG
jgi:hypothetical protein